MFNQHEGKTSPENKTNKFVVVHQILLGMVLTVPIVLAAVAWLSLGSANYANCHRSLHCHAIVLWCSDTRAVVLLHLLCCV